MGTGNGVVVGVGVGIAEGGGTGGVEVAVGVGAGVGVGSGCFMVRAKVLNESTCAWAVEAMKSTVVGSASHWLSVSP